MKRIILAALLAIVATGCAGITTSAEYDSKSGVWRFTVRGEESPVVGVAVPQGSTPEQAVAAFAVRQSNGDMESGRQMLVRAAREIARVIERAAKARADVDSVLANAAAAEAEAK